MHLLLIEDNAINAELFEAIVETDGHTVVVERDGASGEARALNEAFDAIFLDLHLPQQDGFAVLRSLRAEGIRVPIVAVTAAALPEQIDVGRAAGFDDYLTKPIAPRVLRAWLRQAAEAR